MNSVNHLGKARAIIRVLKDECPSTLCHGSDGGCHCICDLFWSWARAPVGKKEHDIMYCVIYSIVHDIISSYHNAMCLLIRVTVVWILRFPDTIACRLGYRIPNSQGKACLLSSLIQNLVNHPRVQSRHLRLLHLITITDMIAGVLQAHASA